MAKQDLGIVTSYAYAWQGGYRGSEDDYKYYLANLPSYANEAKAARDVAVTAEQISEQIRSDVTADKTLIEAIYRDVQVARDVATEAADDAGYYEQESKGHAATSKTYSENAAGSADDARGYASNASVSAVGAQTSKNEAEHSALLSKSWAVGGTGIPERPDEDGNNAKFWADEAKSIIGNTGGLVPEGTVEFADLPAITATYVGAMYIVSDAFTSTSDFEDGGGVTYPAGTNIYAISHSLRPSSGTYYGEKWDIVPGNMVSGVKGGAETDYRVGNVNITKENIGLGRVENIKLFYQSEEPVSTENKDTWIAEEDFVYLKFYGKIPESERDKESWYEKIKAVKGEPFPTIPDPVADPWDTFGGWNPALPATVPDEDADYYSVWA